MVQTVPWFGYENEASDKSQETMIRPILNETIWLWIDPRFTQHRPHFSGTLPSRELNINFTHD